MADAAPEAPPVAPVAPDATPSAPAPASTPASASPPAAPKGPEASRLLAEAARRERAVQAEKAAWKNQRAKEEAAWKERITRAEAVEAKLAKVKDAPLEALTALGLSYEELSIAQLNDGKPGADFAIRKAEEKVAALEAKMEAEKKAAEEKQTEASKAQQAQVLQQWHQRTSKAVEAAGEKYEMINALGYAGEVGKMVEEHYDATGEEVSWTVAADKLEAHLQAEQEPAVAEVFKRLANTKWFKSRYAPVAKAEEKAAAPRRSRDTEVPETRKADPTPSAPTITNKMTSAYQPRSAAAKTRAELRAQAEALLNK
jgi:hypothetical protein